MVRPGECAPSGARGSSRRGEGRAEGAAPASDRWVVLLASCAINLCVGSLYAWSVFATPMAERLSQLSGSDVGSLAIIFTIANAVGPITMISGGAINEKIGVRSVVLLGGALFGVGMVLSGFATSAVQLMLTYGLCVGLGVGMVYGATVSNSVRLFPDRGGLAGGLATASYGLSSVLVPPLANSLIAAFGVATAFKLLGLGMSTVIALAATQVRDASPLPAGAGGVVRDDGAPTDGAGMGWRQMLSVPLFYVMISMLLCGAFSGLMVTSQASPMAQAMMGMTPASAAIVVSALALFNAGGRILAGVMFDRLGAPVSLRATFIALAGALALLLVCSESIPLFYLGICLVGLCFGSVMGIYPGFTASQFGARNNSVNYGIMFIGFAAAGFFGPVAMSSLLGATGSYGAAFVLAAALACVGFALSLLFERIAPRM